MLWEQLKPEPWVRNAGSFSTWSKDSARVFLSFIFWKLGKGIKRWKNIFYSMYTGKKVIMCNLWRCIVLCTGGTRGFDSDKYLKLHSGSSLGILCIFFDNLINANYRHWRALVAIGRRISFVVQPDKIIGSFQLMFAIWFCH